MIGFKQRATQLLDEAGIKIDGPEVHDMQVHDESVYRRVALGGSLALGTTYMEGLWDCDALDVFFDKTLRNDVYHVLPLWIEYVIALRDRVMNTQSVRRALEVGRRHYDLGNDLYAYMLGPSMSYSSAYYRAGAQTLDEAQHAKFDKICRTLGLRPGMKVLEIGCGWGTFANYASEKYGVQVVGISISKEQLRYAEDHGGDTNEFHFMDYRHIPETWRGTFDAVVSIEMIEAVGPKNFREYFGSASQTLKPGGKFLIQAILGKGTPDLWLSTYIFPNGVLPSVANLYDATKGIFNASRWESFGADYDRTLMEWHTRFEREWPQIRSIKDANGKEKYDERFRRMWRYYLLVCAGLFRSKSVDVAQILFTKIG